MKKTAKLDAVVFGLGGMGGTHVKAAMESPYVDKIYGIDRNPAETKKRAKALKVIPATREQVLADPNVKLVYIAAPNAEHVPIAIAALKAGKAVLCEKPMGTTLAEAKKLIDVKKQTGGFLQIGFELHYSKLYMKIKEWIDAGLIGTPLNIQCRYFCCEFHRANNWRSNSEGCFLIGEKLSHYLDLERWWFDRKVDNVYAAASPNAVKYFHHRDNHQMIVKFDGGGVGTMNFIMYSAETTLHADPLIELIAKQAEDGHYLQYTVCGTKGCIESDVFRRTLKRWKFSDAKDGMENKLVETIRWKPEDDNRWFHSTHTQNMRVAELVAKGLPPEVPAEDAYETMRLCFAAEKSTESGKIVRL